MRRAACILASIVALGCGPAVQAPPPKPAPSLPEGAGPYISDTEPDALILHLHDPGDTPAPKDQCVSAHCRSLLELLEGAEHSVDFAIYGMRNQSAILEALEAAKARGVRVRGVVDRDHEGKNYYSSTEALVAAIEAVRDDLSAERTMAATRKALEEMPEQCQPPMGFLGHVQCLAYDLGDECLIAAHASRERVETAGAIMHNKFFIVDGKAVWTGSTNLSDSGTGGYNANLVAVVRSPQIARRYTAEFELMYTTGRYHRDKPVRGKRETIAVGDAKVDLHFSPQHRPITEVVLPLLAKAQSRIDVAIFFLTHTRITEQLIAARRRGVEVRVILDATGAKNGYTKHELLRAAGVPVKVEDWGGKMHAKTAAIDGRWVIAGSMNWTWAGEGGNDENTLIIDSPAHAEQVHAWFDGLWRRISPRWLEENPDPESRDSGSACTDGVDDDFDGKVDAEDPGCGKSPPPLPALPPWKVVPKRGASCLDELGRL